MNVKLVSDEGKRRKKKSGRLLLAHYLNEKIESHLHSWRHTPLYAPLLSHYCSTFPPAVSYIPPCRIRKVCEGSV